VLSIFFTFRCDVIVTVLAQRKLTYTTAANPAAQQSVLLPVTSSAQCVLDQYAGQCTGHNVTGAVAAMTDIDKTPLVWQQRLASSDALQNTAADLQQHTNPLSQVCQDILNIIHRVIYCKVYYSYRYMPSQY